MPHQRAGNRVRKAWVGGLVGLSLALVIVSTLATAQDAAKPPRVRLLFKTGVDQYKRGNYETAAAYFNQAQVSQSELTATEQRDLQTFIQQNTTALQAQREGSIQLRQAEEALREGQPGVAGKLLRGLTANQYLLQSDKQAIAVLTERLRGAKVVPEGNKGDPKSLLAAARSALESGDVDGAESLTAQAEKAQSGFASWIHAPWADTPSKLRRDIQSARAKMNPQPLAKEEKPGVFGVVKNLIPSPFRKDKTEDKKDGPAPPEFPQAPTVVRAPDLPNIPVPPEKKGPSNDGPSIAKGIIPPLPQLPLIGTPEPKVENPKTPNALVNAPKTPSGPTVHQTTFPSVDKAAPNVIKAHAQHLLKEGRKALDAGDLENARKFASQAKDLRPDLGWQEDNPERLLADIQRRMSNTTTTTVAAKPAIALPEARNLLKEARSLVAQNKFDEADKIHSQIANVKGWGLFDDSPEKLRGDIQKARGKRDREESQKLLVEARKLFTLGNLQEAKRLAWQAQKLHGPYTVWDLGDRPQRLLDEIQRVEGVKGGNPPPPPVDMAQPQSSNKNPGPAPVAGQNPNKSGQPSPIVAKGPNPPDGKVPPWDPSRMVSPPPPILTGTPQAANKAKAAVLVAEARDMMRKGFLLDARQRALAADQFKVTFMPGEDSPNSVLLDLATQANRQIDQYLLKATDVVLTNNTDPYRFQKADANLKAAGELALAFGQDRTRVEQKAAWLQQAYAVATGAAQGPKYGDPNPGVAQATNVNKGPLTPEQRQGWDLLDKARLELTHGNTPMARRLAEQAFNPAFGVQAEAAALIRSLDAEDHNQRKLAANRSADAGFDAFQRKDYRYAASIFATVDMKLLTDEKARRVAEIMSMAEMQGDKQSLLASTSKSGVPGAIAMNDKSGKASAGDLQDLDVASQFKAMEEIQFQQLRQRALAAQAQAMEQFKKGDELRAIDTLREYLDQLKVSSLDPSKQALLQKQVENRMNQLRTVVAQKNIEKASSNIVMIHDEGKRLRGIEKTQNEVMDLMKQFRSFQKEGRYKEALAAARKAKELDPDNLAADAAIQIATIATRQREWDMNKARTEEAVYKELSNDQGEFTSMSEPMKFNKDITERNIKNRKTGENGFWQNRRSPAERAIERRLTEPISLNFKDQPLSTVIEDLQALSGVNIVPDTKALEDDSISLDSPISMKVDKIGLKSALNILLNKVRLTYVIKDDVLQITTPSKAKGKTVQVVYPVADLVVPVDNHPTPSINNLRDALARHISGQSGVVNQAPTPYTGPASLPNGQPISSYSNGLGSAFASSNPGGPNMMSPPAPGAARAPGQTLEELLINLITNTVAHDTWNGVGGPGTIQYFPLGMALVVNQTQEVQEDVQALLASLRRLQDLEVAIEMRLVSVSETFFERMGLDFDINLRTGTARREPDLVNGQFTPFGFVNRNLDRLGVVSGLTPAGTLTPDLNIPLRSSSFDFSAPPFGGFPGTLGADGGLSLGLAFLSDIQVFMFLEAAQGDRRMNVMQAPKITVFNGQTASIVVQDQQFFLTGVQLFNSNAQLFFSPQNQPFPLGVTMQVTPVVSADRRFVRLNLQPSMTNLASATVPLIPVQIPVPQLFEGPGNGNTQVGQPVIFQMFFQQPTFTQINIDTTVNVPDGGTVLLGGLKTMAEARNEFGPPILSKIPYLSRLFKNVGYGREGQSLMIMVTPRIIINEEEEQIFLGTLAPIPRP